MAGAKLQTSYSSCSECHGARTEMPQVSIIVPVYNVRRYIDRCIVSILQQTQSEFEVIFVDDCSTDDSASAVQRFARNDSRIVFVAHDRNRGLGAARNTGISIARSDYITFVDSDDFIDANLLEEMIKGSDSGHYDIVETGCRAMDEQDNVLWDYLPDSMKIESLSQDPDNLFLVRELGVTQKLWRRSLWEHGPRQPEHIYWEDIAVVPSYIADAQNLAKIDYAGYNYLQRPTSISNSQSSKHVLDLFRAFECYKTHLRGRGLLDRYSSTFPRHVKNCVQYIIHQMSINSRSKPEKSGPLIVLCRVLVERYLSGQLSRKHLEDPEFDKGIAHIVAAADGDMEGMIESLVSHSLEQMHAA
jgi:glycosyltransferase involved in cell wall biosynthesis